MLEIMGMRIEDRFEHMYAYNFEIHHCILHLNYHITVQRKKKDYARANTSNTVEERLSLFSSLNCWLSRIHTIRSERGGFCENCIQLAKTI